MIVITGGAGFIGGNFVLKLVNSGQARIINYDKLTYAGNLDSLRDCLPDSRVSFVEGDITNKSLVAKLLREQEIQRIFNLAAESHVDRSIDGPAAFIESNITGTFNLLQAVRSHWSALREERCEHFRFHHISTDEVFGSLGEHGRFSETTAYDPRSPYSASKAASDHLVSAWHHTYGLPVVLTNCSNNYGPWQFPEKLIPVVILKAAAGQAIPLYGDGLNVRDWLYVEDHVDALLLAACLGQEGRSYCVGGHGERTNREIIINLFSGSICSVESPKSVCVSCMYLCMFQHVCVPAFIHASDPPCEN